MSGQSLDSTVPLDTLVWQRIATGLNQPLGLKMSDSRFTSSDATRSPDSLISTQTVKPTFTRIFNNDTYNSEHFHEQVMDLQTDAAGNFYYMKSARHALPRNTRTTEHSSECPGWGTVYCNRLRIPRIQWAWNWSRSYTLRDRSGRLLDAC